MFKKVTSLVLSLFMALSVLNGATLISLADTSTGDTKLSDLALGTVVKIYEDGTLFNYLLLSKSYNGTVGNCLLVKSDLSSVDGISNMEPSIKSEYLSVHYPSYLKQSVAEKVISVFVVNQAGLKDSGYDTKTLAAGDHLAIIISGKTPVGADMEIDFGEDTDRRKGTLAGAPLGSEFTVSEDDELYKYTLISHNYKGTGNQLLMRNDTVQYDATFEGIQSHTQSTNRYYYYGITKFKSTVLHNFLNKVFIQRYKEQIRNTLVPISKKEIKTFNVTLTKHYDSEGDAYYTSSPSSVQYNDLVYKSFILAVSELFYKQGYFWYGKNGTISFGHRSIDRVEGERLPFLCTAKGESWLVSRLGEKGMSVAHPPDLYAQGTWYSDGDEDNYYVGSSYGIAIKVKSNAYYSDGSVNSSGSPFKNTSYTYSYHRPCIVLPGDVAATPGEEIVGYTTPRIISAKGSEEWGATNSIEVGAACTSHVGISKKAPQSGNVLPDDISWVECDYGEATLTVTENGTYHIYAKNEDEAECAGMFDHKAVVVDHVDTAVPSAPVITMKNSSGGVIDVGMWSNVSGNVTMTLSGSNENLASGIAKFQYSLDNGTTWKDAALNASITDKPTSTAVTLSVTTVAQTVIARAVSNAGVEGVICEPWDFGYDTGLPTISTVAEGTEWGKTSSITVTASDSLSGIAGYIATTSTTKPLYNANGWQESNILKVNKNRNWYIWAKDKANNISGYKKITTTRVDDVLPEITAIKNVPAEWKQSAEITIEATDNQSGVKEVIVTGPNDYMANVALITTDTAGVKRGSFIVKTAGTYYLSVEDNVGNINNDADEEILLVDSLSPTISYTTLFELDGKPSSIELTVQDNADGSGYDYMTLPNGTNITEEVYVFTATETTGYIFKATDKVGNTSKLTLFMASPSGGSTSQVPVSSNNDTTFCVSLSAGSYNDTVLVEMREETIRLPSGIASSGTLNFKTNSTTAKIIEINGTEYNAAECSVDYSIGANSSKEYFITVMSGNGVEEDYEVILTTSNSKPVVTVANASALRNSVYGEDGYASNGVFIEYPEDGTAGICLKVTVKDADKGQYIRGKVTFSGITKEIHWKKADGDTSYKTTGQKVNGFAVFPPVMFTEDAKSITGAIEIYDSLTDGGNAISTSNASFRTSICVSPPVITGRYNKADGCYELAAKSAAQIKSFRVSYTSAGGSEITTEYVRPIVIESGKAYTINAVATDVLGNTKTYTATVSASDTTDNNGGIGNIHIGDATTPAPKIYSYKSRTAYFYLVGGTKDNTAA